MKLFVINIFLFIVLLSSGQKNICEDERFKDLIKYKSNSNLPNDSIVFVGNGYRILTVFEIQKNLYIGRWIHPTYHEITMISQLKKEKDSFIAEGSYIVFDSEEFKEVVATCEYNNGVLVGQYRNYRDSILRTITTYKNGYMTGVYINYYRNGAIKTEGYFKKGFKNRKWKNYYPNGKIMSEGYYAKSMYQDTSIIDLDSISIYDIEPKTGMKFHKRGTWKYYNEEGMLIRRELYFRRKVIF